MKNLHELSRNPSPYTLPVIPHPLPTEIVEGEHYVIIDLFTLVPSNLSLAQTSEIEVVGQELVIRLRPEQPSLAREDPDPTPRVSSLYEKGFSSSPSNT